MGKRLAVKLHSRQKKRDLSPINISTTKTFIDSLSYKSFGNHKVGVLVVAYNRPDYFLRVLNSLQSSKDIRDIPVVFFLDGGPQSTQKQNISLINNSSFLKHKFIFPEPFNIGCPNNFINARRVMFDRLGFDYVLILPDDYVIAPYYLRLLFDIYREAEKHFDNIGMVQGWNHCFMQKEQKEKHLHTVEFGDGTHILGPLMSRKAWFSIKDVLYNYQRLFHRNLPRDGSYKEVFERKNSQVRDYFKMAFLERGSSNSKKSLRYSPFILERKELIYSKGNLATGEDGCTEVAMFSRGLVRLKTKVNHGKYIGEVGLHSNSGMWKNMKIGNSGKSLLDVELDVFSEVTPNSGFLFPINSSYEENPNLGY